MQKRRMFQEESKDSRAVVIGGILILLVGGYMIFRQFYGEKPKEALTDSSNSEANQEEMTVPTVSAEVVRQKILNGDKVRFLDVRGEENFKTEHIPHSLLLTPSLLGTYTPANGELPVVVFSSNETQTLEVIKNTLKQKSSQLFLLEGGFEQWKKEGNQTIALGDPNSFMDQSKVTYITPGEVASMLSAENKDIFVLDVQSEQNYQRKHIKGAKNIPLDQLEKRSEEIPPAKNIIVYGESELASFQGGVRLSDLNIFTAKTLNGNANLQKESLLPLEP
ncbi:MAG: hypothetical protein KBD65_02850 [Candidatus Moranbacteria bacterium]|nr:hypothetical protein [Candidatus Moranbacteria bacterium]